MEYAVVTGANRGIGLELCKLLKERGLNVIGTCRERSAELEELKIAVVDGMDVNNSKSWNHLHDLLNMNSISLLINNAGILANDTIESMNPDSIRQQFDTNALAPLLLTLSLIPKMTSHSKIAMITSRMGSIADNSSGGYYGYRASKAALNAFGKSLAIDLKKKHIAIGLLHPGFVQTRMVGFNGDISPRVAATNILQRIDQLNLENSGTFWHANGEELPW
ncbi:MAG: hypothetical protein RJB66_2599 [Pseudomonadota bacterium]|jgi:NAD(P)-dependent dehydrogenase (short-subunit alcohol dehydrogenase family)